MEMGGPGYPAEGLCQTNGVDHAGGWSDAYKPQRVHRGHIIFGLHILVEPGFRVG